MHDNEQARLRTTRLAIELAMVDREHGGTPVTATTRTMTEPPSPCGRVLREGAQGEEEWVVRLWARWIGRWRHGGGSAHGEDRYGTLLAWLHTGQSEEKRMSSKGGKWREGAAGGVAWRLGEALGPTGGHASADGLPSGERDLALSASKPRPRWPSGLPSASDSPNWTLNIS
jgi:hypothetical protein